VDLEQFGTMLGLLAGPSGMLHIGMPLVGYSGAGLSPRQAVSALQRGFSATAPANATLVLSVRSLSTFAELNAEVPPREPAHLQSEWAGVGAFVDAAPTAPVRQAPARTRVFISYSRMDEHWLEKLRPHLRPLEREGALIWDDTRLRPGAPWREEIRQALAETKVAILLISAHYLASDFITTNELPPLLEAAEKDGARILPVIISPSRFERMESLSRFQAVNDPQKPLVQLRTANRDRVLDEVARAVEDALRQ
jgi:hypothetical protein